MGHTKEPWIQNHDDVSVVDPFNVIASCSWDGLGDVEFDGAANARRIVACVNACDGFDTELLELSASGTAPSLREIFTEHSELWKQRDELLALVKSMNHMGGDERGGYCICPLQDGSAPDHRHASVCADARRIVRES